MSKGGATPFQGSRQTICENTTSLKPPRWKFQPSQQVHTGRSQGVPIHLHHFKTTSRFPEIKLFAGWFRYKYLMTWFYSEVMWDHWEFTEISHDITNFQLLISPQLAGNAWFGHWDALLLHGLPWRSINLWEIPWGDSRQFLQFHPLQVAVLGVGSGWWVKSSLLVRIRREVFSAVTPRKTQMLVF